LNRLTRLDQVGQSGNTVAEKRVDFTYNDRGQFAVVSRRGVVQSAANSPTLVVQLSDNANEFVIAAAVRIERVTND
jgi:hypothetical protein